MMLRSTATSPFGRKVKIAAIHLGLMQRMTVEPADPLDADDPVRAENPLGKMPVMSLDDGRRLYDSRVILEYLDHLAGGGRLLPRDVDDRLAALTQQALGDGIMDAGILIVYEGRYRPEAIRHEPWLDYQRGKVERGIAALAADPPDPTRVTVGSIACACALGYIDWRKQTDWRGAHASLVRWLDAFRSATPAFDKTAASH